MSSSAVLSPGPAPAAKSSPDLKLQVLSILTTVSFLAGLVPLRIFQACGPGGLRPGSARQLLSCFGAGVFFATCLLDLLPDFLSNIHQAFSTAGITLRFPLPEFIVSMGFFLVLVLEQMALALKDQSSSTWSTEEGRSLLAEPRPSALRPPCAPESQDVDLSSQTVLCAVVLVSALSLHAMFGGVAIGLQEGAGPVVRGGLVLLVHNSLLSFSLALVLLQNRLRPRAVVPALLLFALAPAAGLVPGLLLAEAARDLRFRLTRCTLEGLATGTCIYVTFMEVLPRELGSHRLRLPKVAAVLLGFAAVTAARFIPS